PDPDHLHLHSFPTRRSSDLIALLIQMSISPNSASIRAAAASTLSAPATSTGMTSAFPPSFSTSLRAPSNPSMPRAIKPMRAPSFANLCAVARPTPADAPVITTTSARALISSQRHPHLNPLNAPPLAIHLGGGREAPGEGVLYFSSFILR